MDDKMIQELSDDTLELISGGGAQDPHYPKPGEVKYKYKIGMTVKYKYNAREIEAKIAKLGYIKDGSGYIATYMLSSGHNITESRILSAR